MGGEDPDVDQLERASHGTDGPTKGREGDKEWNTDGRLVRRSVV